MAQEKNPPRSESIAKFSDQGFLSGTVEVDYNIPAEDYLHGLGEGEIFISEIESPEPYRAPQFRCDSKRWLMCCRSCVSRASGCKASP